MESINDFNNESKDETKETKEVAINYEDKYAVLMETNCDHAESWYYFIKYLGNEENLKILKDQIESVDFCERCEDESLFDIEIINLVSGTTAKEMTNLDLNSISFHRKFDGTLQKIDFKFKKHYIEAKKISKINEILGMGGIENYIDYEDIDEDDLLDEEDSEDSEDEEDEDDDTKSPGSDSESASDSSDSHQSSEKKSKESFNKTLEKYKTKPKNESNEQERIKNAREFVKEKLKNSKGK